MARDAEELSMVVDYTKSWQEVFAELAVALIEKKAFKSSDTAICKILHSRIQNFRPGFQIGHDTLNFQLKRLRRLASQHQDIR
jgi:hypothetical protein